MTPEQQIIAISEACPNVVCKNINGTLVWREQQSRIFDPLNDLNAMHEVEKVLTEEQWGRNCITLNQISCRIACGNTHTCGYTIAATAAQRAEAFLRTLDLWKDKA